MLGTWHSKTWIRLFEIMNSLLAGWGKATTYHKIISILYIYSASILSSIMSVFLIACCNIWVMRRCCYFSNIRRVSRHHHYRTISSSFELHTVTCCAWNIWSSILARTSLLHSNTWVSNMPSNNHRWISRWTPCLWWSRCCRRIHNILRVFILSFIYRVLRVLSRWWNRWRV